MFREELAKYLESNATLVKEIEIKPNESWSWVVVNRSTLPYFMIEHISKLAIIHGYRLDEIMIDIEPGETDINNVYLAIWFYNESR